MLSRVLGQASLNPCSNGRCSASISWKRLFSPDDVLILVLMEDALRGFTIQKFVNYELS